LGVPLQLAGDAKITLPVTMESNQSTQVILIDLKAGLHVPVWQPGPWTFGLQGGVIGTRTATLSGANLGHSGVLIPVLGLKTAYDWNPRNRILLSLLGFNPGSPTVEGTVRTVKESGELLLSWESLRFLGKRPLLGANVNALQLRYLTVSLVDENTSRSQFFERQQLALEFLLGW
jgi:hypothetical protein